MTRWTYNYFDVDEDDRDLLTMLDAHGADGWEAYAVTKRIVSCGEYGREEKTVLTFYMKKQTTPKRSGAR